MHDRSARRFTRMILTAAFAAVVCPFGAAEPQSAPAAARGAGLLVRFYQLEQSVSALPQLAAGQAPNDVAIVPTLRYGTGEFGGFVDNFLTYADGFIRIETPGVYEFRLISDDGSRLWIDGTLVVDHDGLHGPTPLDGRITLDAGEHALRVEHFEVGGGEALELHWRPPGAGDFSLLPAALLTHESGAFQTAPGPKRVIPALRRGRAGDGRPVAGVHPAYELVTLERGPRIARDLRGFPYGNLKFLHQPDPAAAGAAIWLPPDPAMLKGISIQPLGDKREPRGQMLVSAHGRAGVWRAFVEPAGSVFQGCIMPFTQGLAGNPAAVRLAGDSFAIAIPELTPPGPGIEPFEQGLKFKQIAIFEISHVSCMSNGLEIEFTKPLLADTGWEPESYYIEQWPFSLSADRPAAPTRDGVAYPVKSASVSSDRMRVFLEIDSLKPGHLVYLRLLPPCLSEQLELPWFTETWYTLLALPTDRSGQVLPRPAGPPQNTLTEEQVNAGWRLLFDGTSLSGWRGFKSSGVPARDGKPGWVVRDGALLRVGPGGDLITQETFDNFELELEWRISPGGNSGIFFRVEEGQQYQHVWETGAEMQVLDNAEHADGKLSSTSAGANYALHAPPRDLTRPVGLYNQVRIVADGPRVEYWLNGVQTASFVVGSDEWANRVAASKFAKMPGYGRSKRGHIALQDHGDKVWFRNIRIRPLSGGAQP